jgi:hypothetical protein
MEACMVKPKAKAKVFYDEEDPEVTIQAKWRGWPEESYNEKTKADFGFSQEEAWQTLAKPNAGADFGVSQEEAEATTLAKPNAGADFGVSQEEAEVISLETNNVTCQVIPAFGHEWSREKQLSDKLDKSIADSISFCDRILRDNPPLCQVISQFGASQEEAEATTLAKPNAGADFGASQEEAEVISLETNNVTFHVIQRENSSKVKHQFGVYTPKMEVKSQQSVAPTTELVEPTPQVFAQSDENSSKVKHQFGVYTPKMEVTSQQSVAPTTELVKPPPQFGVYTPSDVQVNQQQILAPITEQVELTGHGKESSPSDSSYTTVRHFVFVYTINTFFS